MTRSLTLIVPALLLGATLPMAAQNVGRITGKITNKEGQPLKDAKILLKRLDMNWSKTLTTDSKGVYSQAGLDPKDFEVTYSAEGYVSRIEKVRVPIAETITKNIELARLGEGPVASGQTSAPVDEGAKLESEGLNLFNDNLELYKQGRYAEAMAPFESAYQSLKTSLDKTTDEAAKADLKPKVDLVERLLGLTYFQVGKKDQAEPLLLKALDRKSDDQNVLIALVDVYKSRKDTANEKKYAALLEKLTGPSPENAYNAGAEAFNAGNGKEAKAKAEEALKIDPKFADAYYLIGLIEVSDNHMGAAKAAFNKYLELAPNGRKAAEVKGMLKELR